MRESLVRTASDRRARLLDHPPPVDLHIFQFQDAERDLNQGEHEPLGNADQVIQEDVPPPLDAPSCGSSDMGTP